MVARRTVSAWRSSRPAAGLGGKLYVLGGYVNGWTPSAEAYVYDPAIDQWQRLPDLPTSRGSPAAAVIDSKIHVVGEGQSAKHRRA
jgi:N-acetylneuraminic acid mutarotase